MQLLMVLAFSIVVAFILVAIKEYIDNYGLHVMGFWLYEPHLVRFLKRLHTLEEYIKLKKHLTIEQYLKEKMFFQQYIHDLKQNPQLLYKINDIKLSKNGELPMYMIAQMNYKQLSCTVLIRNVEGRPIAVLRKKSLYSELESKFFEENILYSHSAVTA